MKLPLKVTTEYIKVVYHLQLSENSGWEVNGTRLIGSFQWKISGSNRTSEKVVLERLPFEWNFRRIFLDKWNCTFSHQENGTD